MQQRQIPITRRLRGVFPLVLTRSELDTGKNNTKLLPWQCKLGQKDFYAEAAELQISFRQLLRGATASSRKAMEQPWRKGAAAEVAVSQGTAAAPCASVQRRAAGDFQLRAS